MTTGGIQFRKPPSFKYSGLLFKMRDTFETDLSYTFTCHPLSTVDGITNGLTLLITFLLESCSYSYYLKLNRIGSE
jgi:hypothetical protein